MNLKAEVTPEVIETFWSKVERTDSCWVWKGPISRGYGQFQLPHRRTKTLAHRFSMAIANKLDDDLYVDHLCRNRACVNPDHLEMVTNGENVLRGIGPTAVNARKKLCNRGHPLSGENLILQKGGKRQCKICKRLWYWENRREILDKQIAYQHNKRRTKITEATK